VSAINHTCYRAQCFFTARHIATQLGLKSENYTVSFQSRLGRAKWIGPTTEVVLRELAERGIGRVSVSCPSFVADCLETLEEMGIRGRQTFIEAGGEELRLIPSLNADPFWVNAIANWIVKFHDQSSGL
jgi:protoporphyrin/coproporphyrin ferrochelatase